MKKYRINCLDSAGHIVLAHHVECHEDLEALNEGEKLCADNAVEVWDRERLVARIKPGNAPLSVEDHQCL